MNDYAEQLGMKNSRFENSSGLPHKDQYTTAKDIAILSSAMIRDFPDFYKWYSEKEFTYNNITQPNRNKLLWSDSTVDGLKTGYTQKAGYCLVTSAKACRYEAYYCSTWLRKVRQFDLQKQKNYWIMVFASLRLNLLTTYLTKYPSINLKKVASRLV